MNSARGNQGGESMKRATADEIDAGLADILAATHVDIEDLRTSLGLTVDEFAEAVGRSPRSVSRWQSSGPDHAQARGEAARTIRKLARLQFLAQDVLGRDYGPEWLRSPNRGFRGQAPIDLILSGNADAIIAALERLADGGPA